MIDFITKTIEDHELIPLQGQIVVAVSGGADSLCLLHLLRRLCGSGKRYPDTHLHVAHLDHQLRGEASAHDALAVAHLAEAWDIPVTIGQIDVPALARKERRSLEDAARIARYRFLRDIAQGGPIAVAHHQDDQVETLLLHWLRGGGLASMVGLQPRQHDIIRPLLSFTHAQTLAYCTTHQLPVLEDASNSDARFLRNRIRHELLPLLETMNQGFRETLLRNADIMQVDFAWIEEQVDQHWSTIVKSTHDRAMSGEPDTHIQLSIRSLQKLPLSLQRHLLRRVSARLSAGQSPLELRHYRLIEDLINRDAAHGALTLHLPQHIHVIRTGDILVFKHEYEHSGQLNSSRSNTEEARLTLSGSVTVPGTQWIATAESVPQQVLEQLYPALQQQDWDTVWSLLPGTRYAVYVDADKLRDNAGQQDSTLYVRTRRDGDRLQPLGMQHEKKVHDVLIDKHIPRGARAQIPLFFSATHCVWLAGVHLDERVRLSSETKHIIRLAIHHS